MTTFLNDPLAIGMAIFGVVLLLGSRAIQWRTNWEKENDVEHKPK